MLGALLSVNAGQQNTTFVRDLKHGRTKGTNDNPRNKATQQSIADVEVCGYCRVRHVHEQTVYPKTPKFC